MVVFFFLTKKADLLWNYKSCMIPTFTSNVVFFGCLVGKVWGQVSSKQNIAGDHVEEHLGIGASAVAFMPRPLL